MTQRATGFSRKPAATKMAVVETPVPIVPKEPAAPHSVALDIARLLLPYKRHGRLTLRIERVPQLARLSAGRNNGDGTWSLAFDELEGLTYQYPKILKPHTLALRIMAFEGSDVSTLKILDYPVSSDAAVPASSHEPAASEPAAPEGGEKLLDELAKLREILAARDDEQTALRQETESAKAQSAQVQAELAALRADKAESEQRLSAAKVEAALALERARQTWQAEQAAHLGETETLAEQRLAQARQAWERESRDEIAKAQARWKADEAARLAAAEAALRDQSASALADLVRQCTRLESELAAARTAEQNAAEQNAQELVPLRKELEKAQATLAERERDLAQQRTETDKVRQNMQQENARALAEVAERCVALEKDLAQQRANAEASPAAIDDEIVLARLNETLAEAQAALKQREEEMTRRLAEAEQTHQRAQQASDAMLESAKATWKEEEASRLAAAQARAHEESAAALAQLAARCETAEQALVEARKRNQPAAARDDAYVDGLRTELAGLQKTLVAREAELARARAAIEQSRVLYSPPPELPRQNAAWTPLQPEEPPPQRSSSPLLREAVLVILLIAPAILFYPRLVALLPESWQYNLYTLTQGDGPSVANTAPTTSPAMKIAVVPKMQTAILTRGANVRAAPSGTAAVISSLPRGADVTLLDQHGNWTLVEGSASTGQPARGWVYSAFLGSAPAH